MGWTRDTCYIGSHLAQDTCTSLGVLEISILTYDDVGTGDVGGSE